jgi:hypothetical protein
VIGREIIASQPANKIKTNAQLDQNETFQKTKPTAQFKPAVAEQRLEADM